MKPRYLMCMIVAAAMLMAGCGKNMVAVDSGTYQGTISEVNPDEEEIYVGIEGGRTLGLYFNEDIQLMKNNETVPFSRLENGQQVSVQVERVGNRMEPVQVTILE